MGQENVLELLEKEGRWMTTLEVAEIIGVSNSTAYSNLKKLVDHGEIKSKCSMERTTRLRWKIK